MSETWVGTASERGNEAENSACSSTASGGRWNHLAATLLVLGLVVGLLLMLVLVLLLVLC